jgi:hypothetical protein
VNASTAQLGEQVLSLVANSTSGRLGEEIAYSFLRSIFITKERQAPDSLVLPNSTCTAVTWVNSESEVGHPYDIKLIFQVGDTEVVKYCEVKTKTVSGARSTNQFAISFSEVRKAIASDAHYFCMLVSLSSEADAVTVQDISFVGFKSGLLNSLRCNEANLLLQVNAEKRPQEQEKHA